MTARRWRGTIVYVGSVLALGGAALARFGGLPLHDGGVTTTAPVPAGTSGPLDGAGTAAGGAGAGGGVAVPPATPAPATPDAAPVVVTGDVASTPYGPVQVAVTFTGTHIDAVQTLRSPRGGESTAINARATPELARRVVSDQSAQVDTVSGATYTSAGYRESVQSAIDALG